ncbi:glycosyltransferase [Sphingobacterium sp. UBA1498]|uniref:glycosyltransferase n=1 Tax=Sphingobacterium sp. UBA1498 TaxID=1947481 RepID=UPI0025CD8758|nr:glycosyltransferase [Sphingobacterium sp. UBA1498]
MRIIINTATIHLGGALQVAINIIKNSFLQSSSEIYYISNRAVYDACPTDISKTLIVDQSPASILRLKLKRQIKSFANSLNPDIIYSVGAPSYINFKQKEVLRLTNPWIINSLDSSVYQIYNFRERLLMKLKVIIQRFYLVNAIYYITQTNDAKDKIVSNLKKCADNVFVVENTFSLTFKEYIGKNFARNYDSTINVLSIAAPYPHKNLLLLVKIAKLLKESNDHKFQFFITYPVEEFMHSALYKMIKKNNVEKYFTNLGKVSLSDLPDIYKKTHILLLPTLLEVFSASLLEAMVFNLPIITTEFSFNTEVCGNGALYLKNPFDGEEALDKLQKLMNKSFRDELLEKSRKNFEEKITWENVYDKHFKILQNIYNSDN